jgi:mono/diheme cytochrome c family protein
VQKFFVLILIFLLGACTKKADTENKTLTGDELIARGQTIYKMNCISCHNQDPSIDGAVGPAVKGSSFDLIKARVTKAQYPEGYKPKRDTKNMPALPHLESEVPALHAFLNSN